MVQKWSMEARAWEKDRKSPNPYTPSKNGTFQSLFLVARLTPLVVLTASNVRLKLAEDERKASSSTSSRHDDILPSLFIHQGIELEDHRSVLALSLGV